MTCFWNAYQEGEKSSYWMHVVLLRAYMVAKLALVVSSSKPISANTVILTFKNYNMSMHAATTVSGKGGYLSFYFSHFVDTKVKCSITRVWTRVRWNQHHYYWSESQRRHDSPHSYWWPSLPTDKVTNTWECTQTIPWKSGQVQKKINFFSPFDWDIFISLLSILDLKIMVLYQFLILKNSKFQF